MQDFVDKIKQKHSNSSASSDDHMQGALPACDQERSRSSSSSLPPSGWQALTVLAPKTQSKQRVLKQKRESKNEEENSEISHNRFKMSKSESE